MTRGWEHATEHDIRDRRVPKKPAKYGNVKTVVDGIAFHSKREAQTYAELKLRQRAGEIHELECQVPMLLHVNGLLIGKYIADFGFREAGQTARVLIDVKGAKGLPLYQWKKKHVKAEYGIDITEIR